MGWFPVFANFMEGEEFKNLTPTEKLLFWHLGSRFNKDGEFYQSDLEIAKTLATSEKTIRRGRAKLTEMGLIEVKPGTRTKRNQYLATRYLRVRYATMKPEEDRFFSQVKRFTFQIMLHLLRESRLQVGDAVVYVCLSYWFWRNRGKYEDRDRFYISKKDLKSLTNLQDAPTRVPRIYEAVTFSGGKRLFEYQVEHHRFSFKDWTACSEKDGQNCQIIESYLKEIKDSVAREKQDRLLKFR